MDSLIKNKLFVIATPIVGLVLMALLEWIFYEPYINWTPWKTVLIYIAEVIVCISVAFWATATFVDKIGVAKVIIVSFAVGACMFLLSFISLLIVNFNVNNVMSYYTYIAIIDVLFLVLLGVGTTGYVNAMGWKMLLPVVLPLVIAAIVGVTTYVVIQKQSGGLGYVVKSFSVTDSMPAPTVENQKVKVVLLNGQSNATGVARVSYLDKNLKELGQSEKMSEYAGGYDNVYINYVTENGANSSGGSFVHCGIGQGCGIGYFGPELGMAEKLSEAYPDEIIVILKYSWGGSNLHTQWLSPSSGKTGELYQAFLNFTKTSMDYLRSKGYDAEIVAMCWMQGESDSDTANANMYYERQLNLINDARNDLKDYIWDGGMAFIDAGISDSKYWTNHTIVNDAKVRVAEQSELNYYFGTIELGLDYKVEPVEEPDIAHYDSLSEIKLGNKFAELVIESYTNNK